MATQPSHRVTPPLEGPQHFVPPSARELRGQAVQRLQAGLFGIAAVLLVVGLANVINDRARLAEEAGQTPAEAAADQKALKSDPLADIGVVPSAIPEDPEPAKSSPAANAPR
jgi:hypothetical protein